MCGVGDVVTHGKGGALVAVAGVWGRTVKRLRSQGSEKRTERKVKVAGVWGADRKRLRLQGYRRRNENKG